MRRIIALSSAGLLAAGAFVLPTVAQSEQPHKNLTPGESDPAFCDQPDDDTYVTIDPETIWPPNHKWQPVDVTITDESGDMVSIDVVGVTVNDAEGGDGNTETDFRGVDADAAMGEGTATAVVEVRAERSGRGVGRDYVIEYEGNSSDGSMCNGTLTASVPHDRGQGAEHKKNHAE